MLRGGSWLGLSCARALRLHPRCLFSSNPTYLDSSDYAAALYHKLSQKEQYQFLAPPLPSSLPSSTDSSLPPSADSSLPSSPAFQDLLTLLAQEEAENTGEVARVQEELCSKFTEWSRTGQLRVGYLLYLDHRIQAGDYLTKVIKHMSSGNLFDASPHDLTALLLLIYFKRDLVVEEVLEMMDLDRLMAALAQHMRNNRMTREEVCACCLGLKRVRGLAVTNTLLRKELYRQLQGFASPLASPLDDLFVVTALTTLARGNLIFKDDPNMVVETSSKLFYNNKNLQIATVIKILTLPLTLNAFMTREVEDAVMGRVQGEAGLLTPRDLLSLSNYFSKTPNQEGGEYLGWLVGEVESRLGVGEVEVGEERREVEGVVELGDMVECLHYISHRGVSSTKFLAALTTSLARVPLAKEVQMEVLAGSIARELQANLGLSLEGVEEEVVRSGRTGKLVSVFSRIPAFMYSSHLVETEEQGQVSPSLLSQIHEHFHKPLPMQLYSPAMGTKGLDLRTKQLLSCYRTMAKFLGSEQHVRATRLLPHFVEPDLVFGNIGGICLTVPGSLWEGGVEGPRPAPPGDWHVLVIGTRKSTDRAGTVVGQEASKLSQLTKLGYTPVLLPFTALANPSSILSSIHTLLRTTDVTMPNIDDGALTRRGRW